VPVIFVKEMVDAWTVGSTTASAFIDNRMNRHAKIDVKNFIEEPKLLINKTVIVGKKLQKRDTHRKKELAPKSKSQQK
jgi:hypothetical protein